MDYSPIISSVAQMSSVKNILDIWSIVMSSVKNILDIWSIVMYNTLI